MNNLKEIKKVSLWIFIIPLLAVNICWLIVTHHQYFTETLFEVDHVSRLNFTIPYLSGEFSISRSARVYPSYLIFKPAMIFTAFLLIKYWIYNSRLFISLDSHSSLIKYFRFFGIASAVFLVLHSIFLGVNIDMEIYKFFRRFVLLSFIIFELIAQTLLVINFIKFKKNIKNLFRQWVLNIKIFLVITLIIVALVTIPILSSSGFKDLKHILEWNYFVAIISFYFLTFLFWKKK